MRQKMRVVKGFSGIRVCFAVGELVETRLEDGYYTVFPLGKESPSLNRVPRHYLAAPDSIGE